MEIYVKKKIVFKFVRPQNEFISWLARCIIYKSYAQGEKWKSFNLFALHIKYTNILYLKVKCRFNKNSKIY